MAETSNSTATPPLSAPLSATTQITNAPFIPQASTNGQQQHQQQQQINQPQTALPGTIPHSIPSSTNPSASGPGSGPNPNPNPIQRQNVPFISEEKRREFMAGMEPAKIASIQKRLNDLKASGMTKENASEMSKLVAILDMYAKMKGLDKRRRSDLETKTEDGPANGAPPATAAIPTSSGPPPPNQSMTPAQIAQLRSQASAFHLLARNQPVPPFLQQAAQGMNPLPQATGQTLPERIEQKTTEAVISDNLDARKDGHINGAQTAVAPTEPTGPPYAMELDPTSLIYPYNSYIHPSIYAHRKFDEEVANPLNKQQRLLVPSQMPRGLDPYVLMEERNRFVETRMAWRMKELEEMSSTAGSGEPGARDMPGIIESEKTLRGNMGIRARIELLSLRLLGKQKLLREDVVRAMHGSTQIPSDRNQFRRFRTHTLRDARATESAERRQRTEREQRGKQRHLAYINSICEHGQNIINAGIGSSRGNGADKMRRLGRIMMKTHADTEKEEQRRIERLAKERLKALKNDDEDAYLALLGEAKDSRIGHLLQQTDQFLETLAAAVVEQQNDDVHRDHIQLQPFEVEEGPASEAMFGAKRQDGEEEGAERKEGKVDYYAVAHRIQEKVSRQASILTGGTLKDYQVKGLQWMISLYNNRLNGILADEMGLGKTIQTISLITYLIEKKRQPGPFIVIVPLSTLTNWTLEFERWAPAVSTVILKGSPLARKDMYPRLRAVDFQVCLTTYEYIIKERPILSKIKWIHMIIDEGHRMKNVKSKLSQTLNEYYTTRYRLILTGTPLQNNLPELWALLNFVLPKIFNSVKSFDEWFNAPFANTGGEKMEMNEEEALLVVKRLHKVLRPFLLRRLKKDVESELPDKVEKVIYTKMSSLQWKLYESVQKYKTLPSDMTSGKSRRQASLQNALMQLRKICNHPFVFREVDEDFSTGVDIDDRIVRGSGKFELLDRILPKLFKTGHKVLIFFQMTEIMSIIADFFDWRGWKYCRLDGSTKAEDRQALLSTFNDPDSPYQVFILSTRAGGLGLNLQSADTVIIYDTDWNPHADLQAQDRAHRIGQKKEVRVLRLISSNTVEELVLARAQAKLAIDGKVIQAGKFDDNTTGPEYEALLLKAFETNENDNEETNELDDEELNELLARGDHEMEIFSQMDKDREAETLEAWRKAGNKGPLRPPLMAESELPAFYRTDIGEVLSANAINEEEQGRGRRAKADVKYSDGMTDEQWLTSMDAAYDVDDEPTPEVEPDADRKRKKNERKRMNDILVKAEAEGKSINSIKLKLNKDEGSPPPSIGKKKRARPSKSATPSVLGDDAPTKRRKTESAGPGDKALILKLYTETNALESEQGEKLNMYFVDPVNKHDYPDYFAIIKKPICMKQIKRKIDKDNNYSLSQFKADMYQLWDNARMYNVEGSWVHNAAEDMQESFDKFWEEQVENSNDTKDTSNRPTNSTTLTIPAMSGHNLLSAGDDSAMNSGTSTPMYKPGDTIPKTNLTKTIGKLKLKIGKTGGGGGGGGASRKNEIRPKSESDDEDEEESDEENNKEEDEDEDEPSVPSESDDDY